MNMKILSSLCFLLLILPVFSIIATTDNNPPYPPIIEGPNSGRIGETYTYYFTLIDPDDDDLIRLLIEWGDGTTTDECWTCGGQLKKNGTIYEVEHRWRKTGTYPIKAKVWDSQNFESDWSESFIVSMPRIYDYHPILQRILRILERF
ncbi:MAG: hypothetical protein R6V50_05700 [Thermoplasmatota archaeon]